MGVDQMGVAAVEPVYRLVWSRGSEHPCCVDQALARHDRGLDVVLPRAVLDAYPAAVQTGYCLDEVCPRVGQDEAQRCLLWTGTDYSRGVELVALVRASEQACQRQALAQVLSPVWTLLA
ncbi:hypothetical protein GCM10022249_11570 [Enteractinococcus coprophilus]